MLWQTTTTQTTTMKREHRKLLRQFPSVNLLGNSLVLFSLCRTEWDEVWFGLRRQLSMEQSSRQLPIPPLLLQPTKACCSTIVFSKKAIGWRRKRRVNTEQDDKPSGCLMCLNYLPLRHILNMSKSDSHFGTGKAPALDSRKERKWIYFTKRYLKIAGHRRPDVYGAR